MKRVGHLIEAIADLENIRVAFWKAAKGKRTRPATQRFAADLEAQVGRMSGELADGTFAFGDYRRFRVFDPKERVIHAAAFRERVAHHALLNVCEPVLERAAVFDSYACRKGKGRLLAIERAQSHARRFAWFLKMDVRKYFDSIPHARLLELLEGKFKDPVVLRLFDSVVRSYSSSEGRGLPIGSLTSQHFANFYLGRLDRLALESLQAGGYARYMDDFVLWHDDRKHLKAAREAITAFLRDDLGLAVKDFPLINRTDRSMGFLGARVFAHTVRLNHRSRTRFLRKLRSLEAAHAAGTLSERTLQTRATCLVAYVKQADSFGFRHAAGIWQDVGGGQPAPTVSSGVATGTTTPTTRGAPSATTTTPATTTTTSASAQPELDLEWCSPLPEDDPAAVPPRSPVARAKRTHDPVLVGRDGCPPNAPGRATLSLF